MAPLIAEWEGLGEPVIALFGRRGQAMGVDLFVGANYDLTGAQIIWPVPDDVMAQIGDFAGVVAIAYADGTDVDRLIQSNANLAAALGADLAAAPIQTAQQTYAADLTALGAAIAGKSGLKALFMTGAADGFYVGQGLADLNLYAQQGLDIVSVDELIFLSLWGDRFGVQPRLRPDDLK